MFTLSVKSRNVFGKKLKTLREKGQIPAVLYGPKIKPISLEVDLKGFEKLYSEAGESSLISLKIENGKPAVTASAQYLVLIHEVNRDPLTEKPIHVDFYQPRLEEEVEVTIPIIFEGEAKAVKESGGTLIKNISEIEVKSLPQNLPHEIKVSIEKLKTFEDSISIKDLIVPKDVKILKEPEEIVALVAPPEKVEEELEKPVEEKVEEVEKVEEKKEKEEESSLGS